MIALAIVGGGQTTLAGLEPQDERDFAVDHAIGGLKKGSRMLAPEGRSTATSHSPRPTLTDGRGSQATKPGGISPKDAGGLTSGSRSTGAAKFGGGGTQTGGGQGGGSTGGGAGVSVIEALSGGSGTGAETRTGSQSLGGGGAGTGITEEPSGGGSETVSEPPAGGETGGGTEPATTTDTGTSNDLIELDVDVDTTTGGGSADLSVGGEPVAETDVSTGTNLSETTEPVTEETNAALDTGVVTDTTTADASTTTSGDSLTVDVSAGSDTLGDALLGTGSELDPDATTAEETTDILDDCSALDPLSLPEHCL